MLEALIVGMCLMDAPGIPYIKKAIIEENSEIYNKVTLTNGSGCVDVRNWNFPPIRVTVIGKFEDPFFTKSGQCWQFMLFRDVDDLLGITWKHCEGRET